MTLGEWLNRVILDESDPTNPRWEDALEAFPGFTGDQPLDEESDRLVRAMVNRLTERVDSTEQLSGKALSGLDKAITQLADKVSKSDTRLQSQLEDARRIIERVRAGHSDLTDRVKTLEQSDADRGSSPETSKAVEGTVMKLARRLYEHENDVAGRLHDTESQTREVADLARKTTDSLETRIDRLESRAGDYADLSKRRDSRTGETLTELGRVTSALRDRVEGAERTTNDAARTFETSVARLDERLRGLENRNEGENVELERRFDRLSDDVARVIADTRSNVADALAGAAREPRVDKLESALAQALDRIDRAEQRQNDNLSRLGDEITRLASAIDRRLTESEERAAKARAEDQFDKRLEDVRRENKQSMRRMGEQVTRLGTSLADRVSRSEERSSRAVEDATRRMADAVERLEHAKSSREADLEDRLRLSEERTAQRIAEAMSGIQDRLSSAREETEEALTPVQRAMTALADRLEAIEKKSEDVEAETAEDETAGTGEVEAAAPAFDFDTPLAPPPEAETPMSEPEPQEHDPFLAGGPASTSAHMHPVEAPILREPDPIPTPAPAASPQPQAAAPKRRRRRAQNPQPQPAAAQPAAQQMVLQPPAAAMPVRQRKRKAPPKQPARVGATADADFLAAARERTRTEGVEFSRPAGQPHTRRSRLLLILSPILVVGALAGAATLTFFDPPATETPDAGSSDFIARVQDGLTTNASSAAADSPPAPTDALAASTTATESGAAATENPPLTAEDAPANAVADASGSVVPETTTAPEPAPTTASAAPATPAPANTAPASRDTRPTLESAAAEGNPVARYQLGLQQLEGGDTANAAINMRRAAEQGVPAAQYRFSKMLENGQGVTQNLEEARRWTERAANSGHVRAMHNLGVIHYYGAGTGQNFEAAARWFQEAALHGSRDSQFNLALMFERGDGVPLSLPDAYAWYSITANESDPTAGQRAQALTELMPPEALAEAQQIAASFVPRTANAEANGIYPPQAWDRVATAEPEAVRRAQAFLSVLGYAPGPIDGQMGSQTREAIMSFESDQGLPRSGRVDAVLIERLEREAAG